MPVTLEKPMARKAKDARYSYTERRHGRLRCVPSQGVANARHNLIFEIGMILHAEQVLMLHRPVPPAAQVLADHHVVNVIANRKQAMTISLARAQLCGFILSPGSRCALAAPACTGR